MKVSKEIRGYLLLVIIFLAIMVGYTVITRTISGTNFPLAAVETGSMEPNIPTGSLIFIQRVDGANVITGGPPIGDVLVYFKPDTQIYDFFFFRWEPSAYLCIIL